MTIYDRGESTAFREIDRWENGFGWLAHPNESGRRASHAIRGDDGIWLVDPLWAPGVAERIDDIGAVAGVVVCFNWHARDVDRFADHYDVPVFVPEWLDRVEERTRAPVVRFAETVGDSGFEVRRYEPVPGWSEAFAYREADGTLYVPEALGTAPSYVVGDERIGAGIVPRLVPPRTHLGDLEPERILVGHGAGIGFTDGPPEPGPMDAARALEHALAVSRRRLPRALRANGAVQFRSMLSAVTG